jgi:signal transduction histidine kinase
MSTHISAKVAPASSAPSREEQSFLGVLAHELRNPLACIRYAVAANKTAGRTAEQRKESEEIIERQVADMSRLLDDLLDVARIAGGTLELEKERTELSSVLGAAIETVRPLIQAKRHTLTLDLPAQPVHLEADVARLERVFSSLLTNAAKHTDPGGRIEVRAVQDGPTAVVSVSDNGKGISPQMMPRLFTLFCQSDSTPGRPSGGPGIGLSLVRGLAALHGGSVRARSEGIGKGSEFSVRLPISPVGS